MFGEILKIAGWLFFVIFKFIWAPVTLATTTKYEWWQVWLITISGGWLGIYIFYYFGKFILAFLNRRRKTPPRRFTRMNRLVVRIKSKWGLAGLIAVIAIISIPVCSLIAAAYFQDNRRALPAMMVSTVVWATGLTAVVYLVLNFERITGLLR